MNILFYGSGVIGSILAAKLVQSGHTVTVCEMGKRLLQLKKEGIILKNGITGKVESVTVNTTEKPDPGDTFDLAVVPVRAGHLEKILTVLSSIRNIPLILIMVNNSTGYAEYERLLGKDRFVLGFPGMGGGIRDSIVEYAMANRIVQPTTFGEPDGRITERIKNIAALFGRAGFPVAVSKNMDAWQKTHLAWIMPLAGAVYGAGGSAGSLSERPDLIRRMICSVRQNLDAIESLGYPVTPGKLRLFRLIPAWVLARVTRRLCRTRAAELLVTRHCVNAAVEMRDLADELLKLLRKSKRHFPDTEYLMEKVPCVKNL